MCGVVGYFSADPSAVDRGTLQRLFQESSVRGLHAFGLAAWNESAGKVDVRKWVNVAGVWQALRALRSRSLVGHNRYSTSGDWRRLENNQPVSTYNGHKQIHLVFNGVIDMRTREEYARDWPGVDFETENDGEIFTRWLLAGQRADEFFKVKPCSFAGCWMTEDGRVYALRNDSRPLWGAIRNKSVFVASTEDIMRRCGLEHAAELPEGVTIELSTCLERGVPRADHSQQAGRLFGLPPSYGSDWRYRSRIPGNGVSG